MQASMDPGRCRSIALRTLPRDMHLGEMMVWMICRMVIFRVDLSMLPIVYLVRHLDDPGSLCPND